MTQQPTEHAEQVAFVARCRREGITVIMIENSLQFPIQLVLNIIRPFVTTIQLKKIEIGINKLLSILTNKRYAQGMLKGAPDLFIPEYKLFIEMKRRDGGVVSESQKKVHKILRELGYKVEICNGAAVAWQVVDKLRKCRKNNITDNCSNCGYQYECDNFDQREADYYDNK